MIYMALVNFFHFTNNSILKKNLLHLLIFLSLTSQAFPQETFKLMTYNVMNFYETSTDRTPYYKTVIDSINPDILVIIELRSQAAADTFYSQVMDSSYTEGEFIDGPDSDNGIYFKKSKFSLISNMPISTELRDINEFTMVYKGTGDTLRIFAVHLKASGGTGNETARNAEVDSLRKVTNKLPGNKHFIVCGDFNIYFSEEPAYVNLTTDDGMTNGHVVDPITMTGIWNDSIYAPYHTQSTRVRSFGGGASGGMDDRFDMILFSQSIADGAGIIYVNGSTWAVGNDGHHFNDSINAQPNTFVSQLMADALYYASDHLPVIAEFTFDYFYINEVADTENILIYPNPACDYIIVKNMKFASFRIEIMNMNGAILFRNTYCGNHAVIGLADIKEGSYIIRVISGKREYRKIIEKY
jgi:endonuclease/exonuclease/phosphatase family metal-dependent hydrolase